MSHHVTRRTVHSTVLLQFSTKDSESIWCENGSSRMSTSSRTVVGIYPCYYSPALSEIICCRAITYNMQSHSIYRRVCQILLFAAPCALLLQNLAPCFTCEVINVFIWKMGYFISPPSAVEFPARKADAMENPHWQEAYAPSTRGKSPLETHVAAHSIPSALTQAVLGPDLPLAAPSRQHLLPLKCSSQHKPTWLQPAVTLRRSWWKLHHFHDHGSTELLLLPAATGRLTVLSLVLSLRKTWWQQQMPLEDLFALQSASASFVQHYYTDQAGNKHEGSTQLKHTVNTVKCTRITGVTSCCCLPKRGWQCATDIVGLLQLQYLK